MARKPKHEEHENHERWLVSYADFITLLFAFFVVMYSISSVNEGKYRVLSSSLVSAFSHPQKTVEPIQYGSPLRSPIIQHQSLFKDDKFKDENTVDGPGLDHSIMPSPKEMAEMEKIADEIEFNLKELIDKELITVTRTNLGLEIEIKSNVLFASGVAVLSSQAISPLQKIASILGKAPNDINVEGYTDNVPISTPYFPSNWELSAARAASVVRLFTQSGISPNRLKAIGFAEHKPIADNATELGRSKNRRVAIMVLNKPEEKRFNLGLDKKEKPGTFSNDLQKHIPKSIPKPIPLNSLDKSTNADGSRGGAATLLQPQTGKPPITTLPLTGSQSKASTSATAQIKSTVPSTPKDLTQGSPQLSAQSKSGNSTQSTVIVKPAEPISLPVLQVLPKGKGE